MAIKAQVPAVRDDLVSSLESREDAGRQVLLVRLEPPAADVKDFVLRNPDRIVLDILRAGQTAAQPAASGSTAPDTRVIVMLDPGHGGKDGGLTTGQGQEKSITLELALAVRKQLQKEARYKVILTRDKDNDLTQDERATAANASGAQVFVSIHTAAGQASRVYIQDAVDDQFGQVQQPRSQDFLAFEAGSEQQQRVWGRQQAAHSRESGALGRVIARQLSGNPGAEPVQAPLAQLRPVDSAAVLVEAGTEQDRAMLAEALARGIEAYGREDR
jgi:N-acetylmuramoyl-L-alanine amidase